MLSVKIIVMYYGPDTASTNIIKIYINLIYKEIRII